jgi:uncharacterized protein
VEFNVAQLLRESIGAHREYQVVEQVCNDHGVPIEIRGDVSLLRTDRSILVEAQLATRVDAECSRCLGVMQAPVVLDLEEEFYPTVDVVSGASLPPPEDPAAFRIDSRHVLELDEAIRQHLVLAEPMQPLCRPDCAGLCPDCGADLNRGPCRCDAGPIDPRWSVLRALADDPGQARA